VVYMMYRDTGNGLSPATNEELILRWDIQAVSQLISSDMS
jgi:hypothetical protein